LVVNILSRRAAFRGLRPLNPIRDAGGVAALLSTVFSETARSPMNIADELFWMGLLAPLSGLGHLFLPDAPDLVGGYVWIEEGRVVGNVTLTRGAGPGEWLVSNVAVHADYRRRGVARALMEAALDLARRRGVRLLILQMAADNVAAHALYHSLGFQMLHSVTELELAPSEARRGALIESRVESSFSTTSGSPARLLSQPDGAALYRLARAAVPQAWQRVRPLKIEAYQPAWERRAWSWLTNLAQGRNVQRMGIERDGEVIAAATVAGSIGWHAHRIEVMVHPDYRGGVEDILVHAALRHLSTFPSRRIRAEASGDHSQARAAFERAGFSPVRTLDILGVEIAAENRP